MWDYKPGRGLAISISTVAGVDCRQCIREGAMTQFITAQSICRLEPLFWSAQDSDAVLMYCSLRFFCMNEVSHGVLVVEILSWASAPSVLY